MYRKAGSDALHDTGRKRDTLELLFEVARDLFLTAKQLDFGHVAGIVFLDDLALRLKKFTRKSREYVDALAIVFS